MNAKPEMRSPRATSASFTLVGFGMRPEEVTRSLGIEPTMANVSVLKRCGGERKEECGLWSWETAERLSANEDQIGAHIEYLLNLFRPLKSRIEEIRPRPNAFVQLRCKPATALHPLMMPQIESRHIGGIAELGAALKVQLIALD
jgi:hypothetical protein